MFDWIHKWFNSEVVKPPVTTESIRESLDRKRKKDDSLKIRLIKECAHIEENLKLFPIGYPVSEMEVALEYDGFKYYPLILVLKKLIDAGDWEHITIDECRLVQRVR